MIDCCLDVPVLVVNENAAASVSCRHTWAGEIRIISALYESRSGTCSIDVTSRVKELCASSPRMCQFVASNINLKSKSCEEGNKQLKITYRCSK